MGFQIANLPRLIVERRGSAILGLAIIAMMWAGIAGKYIEDVKIDREEAERTNHNFAIVFEENVLRSIGEIDKALLYVRRSVETRSAADLFGREERLEDASLDLRCHAVPAIAYRQQHIAAWTHLRPRRG